MANFINILVGTQRGLARSSIDEYNYESMVLAVGGRVNKITRSVCLLPQLFDGQIIVIQSDMVGGTKVYAPYGSLIDGEQFYSVPYGETITFQGKGENFTVPLILKDLSLSPALATQGSMYSGTIGNKTPGSTITASSSDGTLLTVVGTNVTGTFGSTGSPTIILTETLAGASNTPHNSSFSFTVQPAVAVQGQMIAVEFIGGPVLTDSGASPNLNGACARIKFKGMGRRNPYPLTPLIDPICDPSSLTITVNDPGYDSSLNPTTRTRIVKGTLPLKNPFPNDWASIGSSVPAKSFCSNNNIAYYTDLGGTKGVTTPVHTTIGQTVSDGGVLWTCLNSNAGNAGFNGYVEVLDGADVWVYVMLDMPVYQGTSIVSASIGAGAYQANGVSSIASSGASITNNSLLQYEPIQITRGNIAHELSTGSVSVEDVCVHAWGCIMGFGQQIAGVKYTAWDFARTTPSPTVSVTAPTLSTQYTTSSPGAKAVECYAATINTSSMLAGNSFYEAEYYPWLGTAFRTRFDGEGADWQASKTFTYAGQLCRNGANFYVVTTPGTTASSGGPTGTGTAISDGTVVWNYFGNDSTKQNSRNIQARHHFYNDPLSVYKTGYCFVDPSGTAAGVAGIYATEAAAQAAKGTPANCYATVQLAAAALVTYNNTAGGGLTTHNDCGNGHIYSTGTVTGMGASMQSLAIPAVNLYLIADPTSPPQSVVFANGANKACSKRFVLDGFVYTGSGTSTATVGLDPASDGVTTTLQPVSEIVVRNCTLNQFDAGTPFVFRAGVTWYQNTTFTGGIAINSENTRAHTALLAGCSAGVAGATAFNNGSTATIGCTLKGATVARTCRNGGALPPMFAMNIDSDMLGLASNVGTCLLNWVPDGTTYVAPVLGTAVSGNFFKVVNYGNDKSYQLYADGASTGCVNVVINYNTCTGGRANGPYNDSDNNYKTQWYESHNISLTNNIVYDSTSHSGFPLNRLKCQDYWGVYRVGHTYNCNFMGPEQQTGAPLLPNLYSGLRAGIGSKFGVIGVLANVKAQFVNDTSATGTTPSDSIFGNYHPAVGAEALNMAIVQGRKYDHAGVVRLTNGTGAVGAWER